MLYKQHIFIIILSISIISGCTEQIVEPQETNTNKIKCEQSGGTWSSIICNMIGCEPIYYCDCTINSDSKYDGDILKKDFEFLLPNDISCDTCNDVCISCKQDLDCGINSCERSGNKCMQEISVCKEGICYNKDYTYGSYGGDKVYDCVNNNCQFIE